MYAYMVVLVVVEGRRERSEGEDLKWKKGNRVADARQDKAVGESSGQP
jgi:hypothetical protein